MKKCNKCNIEYDLSSFYKDKSSKDGHRSNCKNCAKEYRDLTKEEQKEYRKEYWKNNGVYLNEKSRNSYNPEIKKTYYQKNKESILEKRKLSYLNNGDYKREYQSRYQKEKKDKRNKYLVEKRKNDDLFRITTNIRNLIINSFIQNGYKKNSKTEEILGCSFQEFKIYLENKFENWMNWENRGYYNGEMNSGWDIDHIVPISSAKNEEE